MNTHDRLTLLIKRADLARPRSLQQSIGPSQVGNPCDRSLGWDAGVGEPTRGDDVVPASDPIPSIVGTAVHSWLESAAVLDNEVRRATGEFPRWLTERQVTARHAGLTITGTVDLFDRSEGAVIDWKVVGVTTLRKAQSEGPSQAYRVQSQIYGLALQQEGFAVRTTSIAMLPRNGPLSGLLVMEEPYDQTIAEQALARLAAVTNTDWADLAISPSDSACRWCSVPWNLCQEGQLHR